MCACNACTCSPGSTSSTNAASRMNRGSAIRDHESAPTGQPGSQHQTGPMNPLSHQCDIGSQNGGGLLGVQVFEVAQDKWDAVGFGQLGDELERSACELPMLHDHVGPRSARVVDIENDVGTRLIKNRGK